MWLPSGEWVIDAKCATDSSIDSLFVSLEWIQDGGIDGMAPGTWRLDPNQPSH